MAGTGTTIRLEVERKFAASRNWTPDVLHGNPPFLSLRYLGQCTFRDQYYDYQDVLSDRGLWLRQRDRKWQMKTRHGGDRLNSQFQEITDHTLIAQKVQPLMRRKCTASNNFGLVSLAEFNTTRRSWIADDDFTLVLDYTDFNHTVGEVELEVDVRSGDADQAVEIMRDMDSRIVRFLERYTWAFSDAPPVGKLLVYFSFRFPERFGTSGSSRNPESNGVVEARLFR